jgi:acyl dehydratase
VSTYSQELPELTFDVAVAKGEFAEQVFEVSEDDVAAYRAVTGDDSPLYERYIPPGFAGIFARQSWLSEHRMPGGGVLLRHDIRWLRPALVGRPLRIRARVADAKQEGDKRTLTLETTAHQDDLPVALVRVTARWPK